VRAIPAELLAREGVQGRLRDAVHPAAGFEALCDVLLDGVLLVRDVDLALALALELPHLRFVTEAGDLVEAGGATGGHRDVAQGPVGRRSHAADLAALVEAADGEIARLTAQLSGVAHRREEKRRGLDELLEELAAERQALARAKSAVDASRARVRDMEQAVGLFRREEEAIAEERARLSRALETARERLARAEASFSDENALLEEAERLRHELELQREELVRAESQAKVEATRLSEQRSGQERRLRDLDRGIEELGTELVRANRLVEENRAGAGRGRAESEELAGRRVELLARRGEVEEHLEAMRGRERAARAAIEELRRRGEGVTRELEGVLGEAGARRLEEQKRALAREDVLRRAEEDFALPAYDLLQDFQPEPELVAPEATGALGALAQEVAGLRAEMERLGPVNLEAVTELEEVTARLDFLVGQRDDLAAARRNLEGTIRTINEESERLFLEAFEEIRGHFQAIFRQLFGGGRADVLLAEGAGVLEAGIEINARPPGRETLPISLLSGGQRTMTALALLFAVFRARPSPFCVLDEVDAALDDANIARFLGLIEAFQVGTQFVIVTHNKGTMAACDRLYGVTMAVRGVSNVVSVELAQVDEFVPQATGNAAAARSLPEPVVELIPHRGPPEVGTSADEPAVRSS
jgi:chromosome segregation protein